MLEVLLKEDDDPRMAVRAIRSSIVYGVVNSEGLKVVARGERIFICRFPKEQT